MEDTRTGAGSEPGEVPAVRSPGTGRTEAALAGSAVRRFCSAVSARGG